MTCFDFLPRFACTFELELKEQLAACFSYPDTLAFPNTCSLSRDYVEFGLPELAATNPQTVFHVRHVGGRQPVLTAEYRMLLLSSLSASPTSSPHG